MINQLSLDVNGQPKIARAFASTQRPHVIAKETSDVIGSLDDIRIESTYTGPHLTLPVTHAQVKTLIQAFKAKQRLHVRYLLELLNAARKLLQQQKNINYASTSISKQITVCGDLHGKLEDLYMIFHKNGLPSVDNPFVFNGDFVDRGPSSIEVATILLACFLASPNEVFLNRGNHEDHVMNLRYGFIKEIIKKYKNNAVKVTNAFSEVFSWLPLATVIDDKVLVVHGGISDHVSMKSLARLDRHKYISVLRPPTITDVGGLDSMSMELQRLEEWKQVLDLLWSDPKSHMGCNPNTFRGGGCYFGPDVTESFLEEHKFQLLIRSHECKPEGFEYNHDGKVTMTQYFIKVTMHHIHFLLNYQISLGSAV
ncbi:serine/threonine-protein phosphatase with EF-hands 2 [Patella vulgata]|uniref:serine/threonine-protein phosphatase with EF-hands 2 n=1 Tax=Patella vulgata TaxID=6465 RepID=UPI0024A8FB8C|nr:serine/threonine-protein phosphatase with EF-hands 2 [Patella vulgata]